MSAEKDVTESFPSPKDFFLKIPLYKSYSKAKDFDSKEAYCSYIFNNYRDFKGTMDCFCIECKRQNTFLSNQSIVHDGYTTDSTTTRSYKIPEYEDFTVKFGCVRDLNHMLTFVFRFHDDTLTKIGQYPSLADLATSEIEKYRSILANNDYRELSKAVGLTAHGVGIGAFVYLRRIFERLIEEAHQEAIKIAGWDEDTYSKSRMVPVQVVKTGLTPQIAPSDRLREAETVQRHPAGPLRTPL